MDNMEDLQMNDKYVKLSLLTDEDKIEFISFNKDKITNKKFNQIDMPVWDLDKFYKATKPVGGLWAGKYHPEEKYLSDWDAYLHNMEYSISHKRPSKRAVKFTLKNDADILLIDSKYDLEKILLLYEFDAETCDLINKNTSFKLDYAKFKSRKINYYSLSSFVDGIYLTRKGAEELAYHKFINENMNISCNYTHLDKNTNLQDWCVESLLLFNIDCIDKQETVRKEKEETE